MNRSGLFVQYENFALGVYIYRLRSLKTTLNCALASENGNKLSVSVIYIYNR